MKFFLIGSSSLFQRWARVWAVAALLVGVHLPQADSTDRIVGVDPAKCPDCVSDLLLTTTNGGNFFAQIQALPSDAKTEQTDQLIHKILVVLAVTGIGLAMFWTLWLT